MSADLDLDATVADAFRDGRAAERGFVAATKALTGWGDEQWRARVAELTRKIDITARLDDPSIEHARLYGRLSIVVDLLDRTEGNAP